MIKYTIPILLSATILIAGIFAFVPIDQATTIHTSESLTLANDSITAAKIATDALTNDELATSAVTEIGTLDRGWQWSVYDDTAGGAQDVILIPAVAGKDYAGRVVLTSMDTVAGRNCVVEDTGGDAIAATADNTAETVQAAFATGAGNLATGEGIRLDADQTIECNVTIFLETAEP